MANKFQKLLFNLSTMSPLALIFSIAYCLEKEMTVFSKETGELQMGIFEIVLILIILISSFFSFYSIWFLRICQKKLERIPIRVDSIVPNDSWVIVVLLSYALPAAGIVFKDINIYISAVVILCWVLFLALSNTIIPNPLLMLQGYHFYKITTVDGSSDICLLSKRRGIHNRNLVKTVMVAFNYLAIEEREENV